MHVETNSVSNCGSVRCYIRSDTPHDPVGLRQRQFVCYNCAPMADDSDDSSLTELTSDLSTPRQEPSDPDSDDLDSGDNNANANIPRQTGVQRPPSNPRHGPSHARRIANAYRERQRRRQQRSDIGPKTKIRKRPPLKRGPDGKPLRRRNVHSSSLYSTHLTLAMALREIRHYQKEGGLVFSRASFNGLVRDITLDLAPRSGCMRWRASALACLQYAAETALCMHFEMLYTLILGPC